MPTSPPTAVMALAADPLVADATVSTPNMTVAETRMTALATTARGLNRQPWPNGRQSGSRHALRTVATLNPASPAAPAAAPDRRRCNRRESRQDVTQAGPEFLSVIMNPPAAG